MEITINRFEDPCCWWKKSCTSWWIVYPFVLLITGFFETPVVVWDFASPSTVYFTTILHPGRLTWNLQITHLERKMIFQTSMMMFHVNLPECGFWRIFARFSSVQLSLCQLSSPPGNLGCPNFNSNSFGMAPKFSKMRRLFLGEVEKMGEPQEWYNGDNNPMATRTKDGRRK